MHQLTVFKSPYPMVRLGEVHDGGYVVAALPGTYDRLISGGVGRNIDFELRLLEAHPTLRGEIFDGTVNGLPVAVPHDRLTFVRKNLGREDSAQMTTLAAEMHGYEDIFLKIDIEGHEFRVMPEILAQGGLHRVKQLVLEVHTPADIARMPTWYAGLADVSHPLMFNMLDAINETHVLVHLHAVNYSPVHFVHVVPCPNVFECTYVRRDLIRRFALNDAPLPTPLDKPSNPDAADIYLRGYPYNTLDEQDFTPAFKQRVAAEAAAGAKSLPMLAIENRVHPGLIIRWMAEQQVAAEGGGRSF